MPKRILPREFTGQHQDRPGFKYKMRPEPEIIRPNYSGSDVHSAADENRPCDSWEPVERNH